MNKIRPEVSGGNWEGVKSLQNCDNSSKRSFFPITFIDFYLSVIFAHTFSMMINSFLLSAAEIFHMYQTRYLNSNLFTQLFIPAFTVVNSIKSHVITWRMGWMLGHTELAECMEISVLKLCVVVDIPQKETRKLIAIWKGNIWNVQNEKLSMKLCTNSFCTWSFKCYVVFQG